MSDLGKSVAYLFYEFRHRFIRIGPIEMAMVVIDLPFDVVLPFYVGLKFVLVSEGLVDKLGDWLHHGLEISRKCLNEHTLSVFSFLIIIHIS